MSCLKWGNLGTHGLVGGEQRRFADAAFLCPSPRSTPIVAWQAFAVERVNRKALELHEPGYTLEVRCDMIFGRGLAITRNGGVITFFAAAQSVTCG